MVSLLALYNNAKEVLMQCGIENYRQEASLILEKITGYKRYEITINSEKLINDVQSVQVSNFISRRKNGEPLQYILGEWEFYGLNFKVGEGVLIPRQDTETLVDVALDILKETDKPKVVDLCSGSGCIAISIDKNANADVFAVELSEKAIVYLKENINNNSSKVKFINGDVCKKETLELLPKLDMIVSNPPYLTLKEMNELQKEVSFEPEMALKAGEDGLFFYRRITEIWKDKLNSKGYILFECGINQHNKIKSILEENGFENVCFKEDLCGIIRVVIARKK